MNEIKRFVKQNLQIILFVLCGVLAVAGILVFVFGASDSDGFLKVMFIVFGILLILLGLSLALLAVVVGSGEQANFFLYDSKLKSNISVDELNFDIVNKKMTFVMANLTSSASKVWTENVFEMENEIFEDGDDSFVPLVAYKILYDLFERSNEAIWQLYLAADDDIIDAIAAALDHNDDAELANAIKFLHENADGNYERTEKFLGDNKKYIQTKMVKYVKNNIDRF
ncbi:MAG: hypothetical protein E7649_04985 [Ruminococcaceae bacterium]|nr:hypothetical protein [Oscillospiraceae bacterium]